ncbi:hypothetical protein DFH09DRAFT_1291026 [Mycena vulgaris]|nr:hypothetical protein DFH09DRAFT_1291026 [Mycena vulgaris]
MVGLRGSSRDLEEGASAKEREYTGESSRGLARSSFARRRRRRPHRTSTWVPSTIWRLRAEITGGDGDQIIVIDGNKQRDEKGGYLESRSDTGSRRGGKSMQASASVGSIFEDAEAARTLFGGRARAQHSVLVVFGVCEVLGSGSGTSAGHEQASEGRQPPKRAHLDQTLTSEEVLGASACWCGGARGPGRWLQIQIQIHDGLSAESTLLFKSEGADRRTQGQIAERGVGVGGRGASAMDIHIDSASRRQAERAHPSPRPTREQNGARIRIERIRGRRVCVERLRACRD